MPRLLIPVAALSLAGCGAAMAVPSPTAVPVANLWPAVDTPIAQATAAQRAAWARLEVTIVPGKHVLDTPPVPTVINHTALSAADAQAYGAGLYKENALYGWATAHSQRRFLEHIFDPRVIGGENGFALKQGGSVVIDPCALYPTKLALWDLTTPTVRQLDAYGRTTAGKYVLVTDFTAPAGGQCRYTVHLGDVTYVSYSYTNMREVAAGVLTTDRTLGAFFNSDAFAGCNDRGYPANPVICG